MSEEGKSTHAAATNSLYVYLTFQKTESIERGNLLPGTAEISNRKNSNYILNDSIIRLAWVPFGSFPCFSFFHHLLLALCSLVAGTVFFFLKKVRIKKLFYFLFPSAKLPIEVEQHPLYQDYGFPHLGMLFLSFSACQQAKLRAMKVENKAYIEPYLHQEDLFA